MQHQFFTYPIMGVLIFLFPLNMQADQSTVTERSERTPTAETTTPSTSSTNQDSSGRGRTPQITPESGSDSREISPRQNPPEILIPGNRPEINMPPDPFPIDPRPRETKSYIPPDDDWDIDPAK